MPIPNIRLPYLLEALKIETDDCIIWPFCKTDRGYAQVLYEGRLESVHRLVLILTDPTFDKLKQALHRCDNPPCFNKRHLFQGTQLDNMRDRNLKGRANMPTGERHWHQKLTASDIPKIRASHKSELKKLAKDFEVSLSTIYDAYMRRTWKHIR